MPAPEGHRHWKSLPFLLTCAAGAAVLLISAKRWLTRGKCPAAIVVTGPSGCGKSTLAKALAAKGGWPMIEGDDHHPPRNKAKLARGVPLTDADRAPFLDSIGWAIRGAAAPAVVSCSALRRLHRERLRRHARDLLFVWIDLPAADLAKRMRRRAGHFMSPSLLGDQLATLEPPTAAERFVRVDGRLSTADQLRTVLPHLENCRPNVRGSSVAAFHGTVANDPPL